MKFVIVTASLTCAVLLTGSVDAAPVSADSATASSYFANSSNYHPENTLFGNGLSTANDPSATHREYLRGNHWTTQSGDLTDAWIRWSFNTVTDLGGIYIWNHQSTHSPGLANNPGYEPTLFDLTLYDLGGSILQSFDDVALAPDSNIASAFTWNVIQGVASVLFEVEAVQSSNNYTGLAEVLFDDNLIASNAKNLSSVTPVPVPAALPLLVGGFGILGLAGWRRKKSAA